jgi:hypothetical protein
MDQIEHEANYWRNVERQSAGVERHYKLFDGFGWFNTDPTTVAKNNLHQGIFKVREIIDTSGREVFVDNNKYNLIDGSFDIQPDWPGGEGGGIFSFANIEDIEEFMQKAGVLNKQELMGREIIVYWFGGEKSGVGDETIGVDLIEYRVKLTDLMKPATPNT